MVGPLGHAAGVWGVGAVPCCCQSSIDKKKPVNSDLQVFTKCVGVNRGGRGSQLGHWDMLQMGGVWVPRRYQSEIDDKINL